MWPWGHALLGYLIYSLFSHVSFRDSPSGREALAVAFASVLPDLIDKPLAWEFGVFESGYALGHSILFAVPLAVGAGLLGRSFGDARTGLAFGVGYLLHLVGDVLPIFVNTGTLSVDHLLWPIVSGGYTPPGLLEGIRGNLRPYLQQLLAFELTTYVVVQLAIGTTAVLLWLVDGRPGTGTLYAGLRRTYAALKRYASPG